jgi:hypothetical protein
MGLEPTPARCGRLHPLMSSINSMEKYHFSLRSAGPYGRSAGNAGTENRNE